MEQRLLQLKLANMGKPGPILHHSEVVFCFSGYSIKFPIWINNGYFCHEAKTEGLKYKKQCDKISHHAILIGTRIVSQTLPSKLRWVRNLAPNPTQPNQNPIHPKTHQTKLKRIGWSIGWNLAKPAIQRWDRGPNSGNTEPLCLAQSLEDIFPFLLVDKTIPPCVGSLQLQFHRQKPQTLKLNHSLA